MMTAALNIRLFQAAWVIGFKLRENGSVLSVENVYCMTCYKAFAYHGSYTSLIYHLQRAHDHVFLFLSKINY